MRSLRTGLTADMALSRTQAAVALRNLGWRTDTSTRLTLAIKDFQRGWNLGSALKVDGVIGPATSAAILKSESRRRQGLTTASAHFSFREFQCKCYGKYAACRRIIILRVQLQRLEAYRSRIGRGVSVVSGYRCVQYNADIGGARGSQHVLGSATDLNGVDKDTVRSMKLFAGIGYGGRTDRALHVDSRDKTGSGARPWSPTLWVYGAW